MICDTCQEINNFRYSFSEENPEFLKKTTENLELCIPPELVRDLPRRHEPLCSKAANALASLSNGANIYDIIELLVGNPGDVCVNTDQNLLWLMGAIVIISQYEGDYPSEPTQILTTRPLRDRKATVEYVKKERFNILYAIYLHIADKLGMMDNFIEGTNNIKQLEWCIGLVSLVGGFIEQNKKNFAQIEKPTVNNSIVRTFHAAYVMLLNYSAALSSKES